MKLTIKDIQAAIIAHELDVERSRKEFEEHKTKIQEKIYKLEEDLKKVCKHTKVEYIDNWNYHNNRDDGYWECKVCKKHVQEVKKYE